MRLMACQVSLRLLSFENLSAALPFGDQLCKMRDLGQRAGLRLPVGVVPKNRVEIVGRGKGEVLDDNLHIPYEPLIYPARGPVRQVIP